MKMDYKNIKYVEKPISKIILGTPSLPHEHLSESYTILDKMYALGVNTFDTAHVYPNDGESILFGWAKKRAIRDKVVILSKCAHPNRWRSRVTTFDIMSDITDTLSKRDADYIDIYMLHRDNPSVDVGPIIEVLNELYEHGKIKSFGASNWTHDRVEQANEYAYKYGLMPFSSISPNFGLAEQIGNPWGEGCVTLSGNDAEKARMYYRNNQMPVFSYSPLGRGFFSGMIRSSSKKEAEKILDKPSRLGYMYDSNFERLRRVEMLADELNLSVAQLAMAWLFNQPLNIFAIVGVIHEIYMKDNIDALHVKLTKKQLDWLDLKIETI